MGGNIFFTTFAPLQIVNNVKQKILIKDDIFNYCDYRGLCRGLSVGRSSCAAPRAIFRASMVTTWPIK